MEERERKTQPYLFHVDESIQIVEPDAGHAREMHKGPGTERVGEELKAGCCLSSISLATLSLHALLLRLHLPLEGIQQNLIARMADRNSPIHLLFPLLDGGKNARSREP